MSLPEEREYERRQEAYAYQQRLKQYYAALRDPEARPVHPDVEDAMQDREEGAK
jgi:hypothetical protein